jgi:hypothetical protein
LQFFLSLQHAEPFSHLAPFLQHDFSCAKAPPDNKTAVASNNVSFFIFADLEVKDRELIINKAYQPHKAAFL